MVSSKAAFISSSSLHPTKGDGGIGGISGGMILSSPSFSYGYVEYSLPLALHIVLKLSSKRPERSQTKGI
jgi:hypothetical protein